MNIVATELPYIDSADLFAKVADQSWAIFLDSAHLPKQNGLEKSLESPPVKPSKNASFDVLAIKPETTLVFDGEQTRVTDQRGEQYLAGDPLTVLQSQIPEVDNPEQLAYVPGAIGYFSYDLARYFEKLPALADNPEQMPAMAMGIYHVIVVVDHEQRKTTILQLGTAANTHSLVRQWRGLIRHCLGDANGERSSEPELGGLVPDSLQESMSRDDYGNHFKRVREYTIAGDCYQVNLAKQFSAKVTGNAWSTYRNLRDSSPAPYGAFMNFPFAQVLSNSPESFIQCRDRRVITSPIKGTRPRDHRNKKLDKANAKALLNSTKDRAENLMIVDLMRNDLSRCCELGSVKVPVLFEVHSFANVHHLISQVSGMLRGQLHALDLLRSCFPGGSITGAPKIRAMHIIEELEPTRRGLYCGAIAYVGADGNLETNIAIRTIVIKDGVARYSAGGGLVIDSDEESEYQELLVKSKKMTQALFKNKR